jgi:hypothetical protein
MRPGIGGLPHPYSSDSPTEWCTEARGSGRGTTDVGKRAQVADLLSRCLVYPKAFLLGSAERREQAPPRSQRDA